mmetsp:Transcript_33060/g.65564  ORF Transcript_33060/g.65564 Transcript_33060/m.65564 type:complete len:114 (+) Transcript_33060:1280-1621(+)
MRLSFVSLTLVTRLLDSFWPSLSKWPDEEVFFLSRSLTIHPFERRAWLGGGKQTEEGGVSLHQFSPRQASTRFFNLPDGRGEKRKGKTWGGVAEKVLPREEKERDRKWGKEPN